MAGLRRRADRARKWDIEAAERGFRAAIQSDPNYTYAHLWLAQTLVWGGRPVAEWGSHALTSAAAVSRLGFRERSLAQALAHLATQEFFQACAEYRKLIARDSLDFAGWFGLGDCQTRDRAVVRDSMSPSGWRFRSSYSSAADALQRALELIPSVHRAFTGVAFSRLTRLFYAEPGAFRIGYAVRPDTIWFGAWPGLDRDTLFFTPFPMADFFAARPGTIPSTAAAALTRNRDVLRQITVRWLHAFPNSADANEALGRVLETMGELADRGDAETSALGSVRRARQLSIDSVQRLRLTVAEVRLLVKLEAFDEARVHADSVLRDWDRGGPDEAAEIAGLAALTGHVFMAADLLSSSAAVDTPVTSEGRPIIVPRPAVEPARMLVAYAAFGAPRESLIAVRARSERAINTWVEQRRKSQARDALLYFPSILAFPDVGLSSLHKRSGEDDLLALQWAFAHRDTASMRASFVRLDTLRKDLRPGDWAVSVVYHESWLLLAVGDTSAALRRIDPFLDALQTVGLQLVKEVAESALLVRLMVLRADIAARRSERAVARRWGAAVVALWAEADPVVQPTVERMRALANTR